jgi:SAM-dependent methyltransferase
MNNTTTSTTSDEMRAFWNGPIGERWVAHQEKLDRSMAPLTEALFRAAHLAPGERVLDVGCGTGTTLRAISTAVGATGSVVGVDISAPMLALARERTRDIPNVTIIEGDAGVLALDPPVDAIVSRFGVMFFADPVAAFTNFRRVLRPSGRIVFVAWRTPAENEWVRVPLAAVESVLGPAAPTLPDAPGPFAFADRARLERIMTDAGFAKVAIERFDATMTIATTGVEEAVTHATMVGPASRRLTDASDEARPRAIEAIRNALTPHVRDGVVTLKDSVWIVTASARTG